MHEVCVIFKLDLIVLIIGHGSNDKTNNRSQKYTPLLNNVHIKT